MVPAAVVAQCLPAYMQAVTRAARLLPMNSPTVSVPPLPVDAGCRCCAARGGTWQARRAFVLAAAGTLVLPVAAQVEVGSASGMRRLVPAEALEDSAVQQYSQLLAQAKAKRALAPDNHPQLLKLRAIARQIIPYAAQWNSRAARLLNASW